MSIHLSSLRFALLRFSSLGFASFFVAPSLVASLSACSAPTESGGTDRFEIDAFASTATLAVDASLPDAPAGLGLRLAWVDPLSAMEPLRLARLELRASGEAIPLDGALELPVNSDAMTLPVAVTVTNQEASFACAPADAFVYVEVESETRGVAMAEVRAFRTCRVDRPAGELADRPFLPHPARPCSVESRHTVTDFGWNEDGSLAIEAPVDRVRPADRRLVTQRDEQGRLTEVYEIYNARVTDYVAYEYEGDRVTRRTSWGVGGPIVEDFEWRSDTLVVGRWFSYARSMDGRVVTVRSGGATTSEGVYTYRRPLTLTDHITLSEVERAASFGALTYAENGFLGTYEVTFRYDGDRIVSEVSDRDGELRWWAYDCDR